MLTVQSRLCCQGHIDFCRMRCIESLCFADLIYGQIVGFGNLGRGQLPLTDCHYPRLHMDAVAAYYRPGSPGCSSTIRMIRNGA